MVCKISLGALISWLFRSFDASFRRIFLLLRLEMGHAVVCVLMSAPRLSED